MENDVYSRRKFLKTLGAAAVSGGLLASVGTQLRAFENSPRRKPNIILLLADDLGYGDIGCYGNRRIKTPNLDAMAETGMKLTDFHSNGPMCSPTRAALLTGRYQQRCGIESVLSCKSTYYTGISPQEITFAEVLQKAGYATACLGKWHLGFVSPYIPSDQGFDTYRGYLAGGSDYFSHIDRSGRQDWWKNKKVVPEEGYTTELLTTYAIDFMKQHRDSPFCIYVPYQAVHFPFQGPDDSADRLIGGDYWSRAKYGRRYKPVADRKAAYKEMIESLDSQVGRIINAVKKSGLEKETLIFFTSDNGAYSWVGSNLPCRGQKTDLWEGGHRVPAIAYWPGKIKPGSVSDETTMTMDLFPTMLDMAGIKAPDNLHLDGTSLLPVLLNNTKLRERTLYWRFRGQHATRRGKWKFLVRGKNEYLFNLEDDIGETTNLIEHKPGIVKEFKSMYDAWEKDVTEGVKWVTK